MRINSEDFYFKIRWILIIILATLLETCSSQESLFNTVIYHQLMKDRFYPFPNIFSTTPSIYGAISANIDYEEGNTLTYYIELQRYAVNWISAGAVLEENTYIETGYLIANWGFDRQSTNGSGTFPDTEDGVHSTSLFLEAVARASIVMKNKGSTNMTSTWIPKMLQTANYMIDPTTTATGRDVNLDPFTHRFFLRACAAEMTAFLVNGDATLSSEAKKLVEEGLTKQDAVTGILPERDGFDFNYQIMSLTFLGRYYMFADDDGDLKTRIVDFMNKALPSIMQRVDGLGNIDLSDSTRINEIGRNGKGKTLDWANIYQGLISTCLITNNDGFCKLRDLLMIPIMIVGYNFNIQESGIKSLGRDATGIIYTRTADNAGDAAPLGSPKAVGVTEQETDFAYDLTGTSGMGVAKGKFARTDSGIASIDGLLSLTFTGWFKTDIGEVLGNEVELFKTNVFRLIGVNNGHLKLYIDSRSNEADSVTSTKADWADVNIWTYFAVSYDGTKSSDNVKFYKGAVNSPIVLSSTQTLNKGSVDAGGSQRLYISTQNHPFDGYLDDMRIYGTKDSNDGALSIEQLEEAIAFDFRGVEGDGTGDPHFFGFDGVLYYFHGENNQNYIIFGEKHGDTLVGKVRATNELQYGVNKTYFSQLGLRISSTRQKIRFSLKKVVKSTRYWVVKTEVNGKEISDDLETEQFSIRFNSTTRKVRVETEKFKFIFHGVSLTSMYRRHLDFSVSVKGVPSIKDNYIGVLGMTLSRRLGSNIHDELYKDFFNQTQFEVAMRRHYGVGEYSLHPNLKFWKSLKTTTN